MMEARLIHPEKVKIQKVKSSSLMDDGAKEAVFQVKRETEFVVKAQVVYGKGDDADYRDTGIGKQTNGYLVIRQRDLRKISQDISFMDKIIEIGGVPTVLFVTGAKEVVNYTRRSQMFKVPFSDKRPTREQ